MGFLLICIVTMAAVASLLFYIGIKISYSFIRYSPSITLSVGVIFYLLKLIYINSMDLVEFALDFFILCMLLAVWFIAIVETVIIDVIENGQEYKRDIQYLAKKTSIKIIKPFIQKLRSSDFSKKLKTFFLTRIPLKIEESQKENNG